MKEWGGRGKKRNEMRGRKRKDKGIKVSLNYGIMGRKIVENIVTPFF